MAAVAGIICGLVAAAPLVWALGAESPGMGRGIAAVAFAFLFLQAAMMVARLWRPDDIVSFGALGVLAFLAAVIVAVIRRETRR